MKLIYPAIFHTEEGSVWVEFPDLDGCNSYGDDISDALDNAKEALEGYCMVLLEQKKPLPKASSISKMKVSADAFPSLVETDLSTALAKNKSVKKTLTIPAWLNDMATDRGINFSQVLQNALFEQMEISKYDNA